MDLEIFEAGRIHNKIEGQIREVTRRCNSVRVTVPARLNAMCFDLKTLAKPKDVFVYSAGELAFSVDIKTSAELEIEEGGGPEVVVSGKSGRKSIVRHAGLMMARALGIRDTLHIEAHNHHLYPHAGLGSSSSIITSVCVAINKAYGSPLDERQLTLFIARNHGEEIDGDDENLVHVQCNGGSPSVALYGGGMQVIVGDSRMMLREEIPPEYTFVFGIPELYKKHDAKFLMEKEAEQFPSMLQASEDFSREIAWKVLNQLRPAVLRQDMLSIGDVLRYYRFETGSLKIDSGIWEGLRPLVESLQDLRSARTPIVSVSSCGPAVYALTKSPSEVYGRFREERMQVFSAEPDNTGLVVSSEQEIKQRGDVQQAARSCSAR